MVDIFYNFGMVLALTNPLEWVFLNPYIAHTYKGKKI
jgi:hypothetical protein